MRTPFSLNRRRQLFAAVIEQRRFFGSADQPARQRASLDRSSLVEFAKLRNRLDHAPSDRGYGYIE